MSPFDLSIAIGGAAGQGIATPGDILARIFVRRGLHLNAYNAYQSIIRGGHIFLTLRTSDQPVLSHGDTLDVLMPHMDGWETLAALPVSPWGRAARGRRENDLCAPDRR